MNNEKMKWKMKWWNEHSCKKGWVIMKGKRGYVNECGDNIISG